MKRFLVMFLIAVSLTACAQKRQYEMVAIAFYNVENLFDITDDTSINDEDFLPDGYYTWNEEKYKFKLTNISCVLSEIAVDRGIENGPAVIGLAEIENRAVVRDLVNQPALAGRNYKILHFDSPDKRGIDCAMLYREEQFKLIDSMYVNYSDTTRYTRGYLVGIGKLLGEDFAFIVCHWPSRGSQSYTREIAGRDVRRLTTRLQELYEGIKIVCLGDLNDDPDNKSLSVEMDCAYSPAEIRDDFQYFNPWKYTLRTEKKGTLVFKNNWNLFDQILLTGNMVTRTISLDEKPSIDKLDMSKGLTYMKHEIISFPYMMETEKGYLGNPLRTHVGQRWMNGFSDHFPTCIYLVK